MAEKGLNRDFNNLTVEYINGSNLYRSDFLVSIFLPWVPFTRHAKTIIREYERLRNKTTVLNSPQLRIRIEPYAGENPYVHEMMNYLNKHLKDCLVGAYVHGSLGTYEQIAYSDFDALVILKDEVFESPKRLTRTARILNRARTIMLGFDPLEHHGWFVLTEADLKYYCNSYFPVELFSYAKSLFNDKGLELKISLRESNSETHKAFEKMVDAIIRKIENRRYPTNVYQLKGLLSQFMLLPALYLQAKNGCGIYKKESFGVARSDFGSADWAIMDEVSEIRANWNYEISPLQKWLMSHPYVLSRYYAKRFGPQIPKRIGSVLTAEFYSRIEKLASLMIEKLA